MCFIVVQTSQASDALIAQFSPQRERQSTSLVFSSHLNSLKGKYERLTTFLQLCMEKGSLFALIGLCLYILDCSTDSWVGRILIQNCHTRYGALVFFCIFGPSSLFAFAWEIMETDGCPSISKVFKSLIRAIFAIPLTIFYYLQFVITQNHESLLKAKRYYKKVIIEKSRGGKFL